MQSNVDKRPQNIIEIQIINIIYPSIAYGIRFLNVSNTNFALPIHFFFFFCRYLFDLHFKESHCMHVSECV